MKTIEQLQEDNAALAAQVEALRDGIGKAREELSCCNVNSAGERLSHLLELTPQQHLAEIRADAGRAGFVAGVNWAESDELPLSKDVAAKLYADSIRQGEVE